MEAWKSTHYGSRNVADVILLFKRTDFGSRQFWPRKDPVSGKINVLLIGCKKQFTFCPSIIGPVYYLRIRTVTVNDSININIFLQIKDFVA
jgi:hypothetical protein